MKTTYWLATDDAGDIEVNGAYEQDDHVIGAGVEMLLEDHFTDDGVKFLRINVNEHGVPGVEDITDEVQRAYDERTGDEDDDAEGEG